MTKPYVSGTPYINRMGIIANPAPLTRKVAPYLRFIGHTSNAIIAILEGNWDVNATQNAFKAITRQEIRGPKGV